MFFDKEIWVGVILTAFFAGVFGYVHERAIRVKGATAYTLNASFNQADGLSVGSAVRLAGIPVGRVGKQTLAPNGYQVLVQMVFDRPVQIPLDSSVRIETDGILGAKHLEILPGGDEEYLRSGDMIDYTQDSLILNDLISKVNTYMQNKKQSQPEQEVL